jgi:hypothetical protein
MSITNCIKDFPYSKRFYLTHLHRFIQECWWNLKATWRRATKGHAWRDSAEMNEFLLYIIPSMLRDIANGEAYPGDEEFPTYESWQSFCNDLAAKFEYIQEEKCSDRNEYNEQFMVAFDFLYNKNPNITMTSTMSKNEAEEVCRKYRERENEIYEERRAVIHEAFSTLEKYYDYFWI